MGQALAELAEVSTVGWLPAEIRGHLEPRDDPIGLEHSLLLWGRKPAFWHRWYGLRQLRKFHLETVGQNRMPDILLVSNILPVFNHFVRWLRKQRQRPFIVFFCLIAGVLADTIRFRGDSVTNSSPCRCWITMWSFCVTPALTYLSRRGAILNRWRALDVDANRI